MSGTLTEIDEEVEDEDDSPHASGDEKMDTASNHESSQHTGRDNEQPLSELGLVLGF
jgi:hypothetical protein